MREPSAVFPVAALAERARAHFRTGATLPSAARIAALDRLEAVIRAHQADAYAALKSDLGKGEVEAHSAEVGFVLEELAHLRAGLEGWLKPKRVFAGLAALPGTASVVREPLGTALIIGPWNYPFQLAFAPLAGALAAGCNAVLKPSELAPATAALVERMLTEAFGSGGLVSVVQGGPEASTALLEEQWDVIFFTGSTRVGQVVAQAAAKHLTPTVLELGGKSPTLIDRTANLAVAAKRIAWGKFYNAGQTCIAPDYLLVEESVYAPFLEALKAAITSLYGADPKASPDYGRIINARHFERLSGLVKSGTVAVGGQSDAATRYLAPTLLTDVQLESTLMQEEIFGPLLPVLKVKDMGAAISFVRARPKPLALYIFSGDDAVVRQVLTQCSSGGACVNDVLFHISVPGAPFGGVGQSGSGAYHGEASIDAFSHRKTVFQRSAGPDLPLRYPPYSSLQGRLFKFLLGRG
jgi:aldehyde dehydrogenase (NAD+)